MNAQTHVSAAERNRDGVAFAHRMLVVRRGMLSGRVALRPLAVQALLVALAVALAATGLLIGEYPLTPAQVLRALVAPDGFERTVVVEWRLPAAAAAVVFGALLGVGGGIFQSLTRNPLGSPDVIGFDAGAYTAVVITMLVLGANAYGSIAVAAIVGGLLTALVVYLLAARRGVTGFRLIVVGLAVSAVLGAANAYLITRANVADAMSVGFWGAGTLARVDIAALPLWLALAAVIAAGAVWLAPSLRTIELGDDAAAALGVSVERQRLLLIVVGVASTAVVTAAAGPIGFVALAAPQLARRLMRSAGVTLAGSAAMGAALLSAAQLCSTIAGAVARPVPVGLITVCVGGLYLIWLLLREGRRLS